MLTPTETSYCMKNTSNLEIQVVYAIASTHFFDNFDELSGLKTFIWYDRFHFFVALNY